MLYEYLKSNYLENEPIFVSDIKLPVSDVNLRRMFKELSDTGKIERFDKGIYYLPKKSLLKGGVPLSVDTVIRSKYVVRKEEVEGYYSGYTFANQLGLTSQVPYLLEIVSNHASARFREIEMKGRRVVLRKPRVSVTRENYLVLQVLDLLSNIEKYSDISKEGTAKRLKKYIEEENISKKKIDTYIKEYPDRIYKNIYEMEMFNVFT